MMIELRDIKQTDLVEIEKLYEESIKNNKEGFIQQLHLRQNIKDFIVETQNNGGVFIGLFINNIAIGMIGAAKTKNMHEVEICKFHLSKKFQGRKLGQMIYSFLEFILIEKGIKTLKLHVTKTQKKAIALYKKNKFIKTLEKTYAVQIDGEMFYFVTIYMNKALEETNAYNNK